MSTSATWSSIEQVAVDDPDAALAGERDREPRLGDRVHRRRDDRDLERDRRASAASPSRRRSAARDDSAGHEQDVVEREALPAELLVERAARSTSSKDGKRHTPCPGRLSVAADGQPSDRPASSTQLDAGDELRPRLARVEAAGADLERRGGAGGDGQPQRLLGRASRRARAARNCREQDVAGADRRDRLDAAAARALVALRLRAPRGRARSSPTRS